MFLRSRRESSHKPVGETEWTKKGSLSAARVRSMSAGSAGQRQAGGIKGGATWPTSRSLAVRSAAILTRIAAGATIPPRKGGAANMKKITLENVRDCFMGRGFEIKLSQELMETAVRPIERMLEIS